MDIYEFRDYRKAIETWAGLQPGSGIRSKLAKAANCSPSWITRVLSGSVQLTPDQAFAVSQLMLLKENESDYFLLLVDLERASSIALKKRIDKKLALLRKEGRQFKSAVNTDSSISHENMMIYYSSWVYSAIHTASMIEGMTFQGVLGKLKLSEDVISKAILELKQLGIIESVGNQLRATSHNLHLSADHSMAKIAHMNWRAKTISHFQEGIGEGLHYSAVHCLSVADMERIRKELRDMILNCRKRIEDSDSEALAVLCLDWYQL